MTNPLQRAAEALVTTTLTGGRVLTPRQALDVLQIMFESIDINELADVISGWPIGTGYYSLQIVPNEAQYIACAVKNWLTGKETS